MLNGIKKEPGIQKMKDDFGIGYAREKGYSGKNIGIAVFDTGIFPHEDFDNRLLGIKDFVNNKDVMYDDNGHGTHVSGIIGGNGIASGGQYQGVAPEAMLYAVKILDHNGVGSILRAKKGVEHILDVRDKYKIRIINFSMGMGKKIPQSDKSSLLNVLEKAWDSGIIVVCAAGNNGPGEGSVTPPGNLRKIITVGASDDDMVEENSGLKKNYSGRGPTASCIVKPEIVAPGTNIISCNNIAGMYAKKSGTSMSTPFVTGCIAVLLEKYPNMSPAQVKYRLYETAIDLGLDKNKQGWGLINLEMLLRGKMKY